MADNNNTPPPSTDAMTLMASLLTLNFRSFSDLRRSLVSDLRLYRCRLVSLLLSPPQFSLTLSHLRSLSLSAKTTLLARFLLRTLHHFVLSVEPNTPISPTMATRLRDIDAAVLLMAMCEAYDDEDEEGEGERPSMSDEDWKEKIKDHLVSELLSNAGLGVGVAFERSVGVATKCKRFLGAVSREEKVGREVGAAVAAVVSLESANCGGGGKEWCVVCREEMEAWRDVCTMPCGHRFHWACILPWLRRRNTCPCCRFELPSDDVFCEIGRMWKVVAGRRRLCRNNGGGEELLLP